MTKRETVFTTPKRKAARSNRAGDAKNPLKISTFSGVTFLFLGGKSVFSIMQKQLFRGSIFRFEEDVASLKIAPKSAFTTIYYNFIFFDAYKGPFLALMHSL